MGFQWGSLEYCENRATEQNVHILCARALGILLKHSTLSWVSGIALWGIVVQRSTVGETWTRLDKRKQTNKQINLRTTAKGKKNQEGQVKRLWIKSYRGVGGTTCTISDFFSHHLIEVWRMRKVWWNGKQQPTSLLYLEWKLLVTQDVLSNDSMKRQQQQDSIDPSSRIDSDLFKDPLKQRESEHEQEWKFRQVCSI